ncbi:MAG: hypothetical protein ACI397_02570, partial [Paludibacteraceae bacterium]
GMFVVSVAGVAVACFHFNKQQKLDFFARYTERYQHIIEQLPEYVFADDKDLTEEEYQKIMPIIRAYFDLCSEEFYLHKQHHLSKNVWKEWEAGMVSMFQRPVFKQCWKRINPKSTCYSEFALFVQKNDDANTYKNNHINNQQTKSLIL